MLKGKQKQLEQAADLRLQSQIGEEERFWDLMRRMARENRTAVISFFLIVLMIGAMVIITTAQIICRIWFTALSWSEEVTRFLLIWATFLGSFAPEPPPA